MTEVPASGAGPGPAPTDRPELEQLRRFAWILDSQFRVPGTNFRFGVDALVGLIPGFGDFAGAIASTAFLVQGLRIGAPKAVMGRMFANVVIETLVGAIPGLGDLFDASFKANQRNLRLLERLVAEPEAAHHASRKFFVWMAIATLVLLLAVGVLAVVIGVMIVQAIVQGRGPLG